jgi:hypothetical protein
MVRKITTSHMRGAYKHAVCALSDSRIRSRNSPYKPVGTLTAVANPWHGHVIDKGNDSRLGNCSYVTLQGKGQTKLTYMSVYRVNDQQALKSELNALSGGRGHQRANTQQLQILREESKLKTLPRHNCFDELRAMFKVKFSGVGHEVVMGIDANKSMKGNRPRSLRRFMSDVGMHDAIAYANPGQTGANTVKKGGSEAVDHILATGGVLGFILAAGELNYDYTYVSDHPSLFCDVDGAILSGDFTHFSKEQGRNLHYKDKAAVVKYNDLLEKLCEENSIHERTYKLFTVSTEDWAPHHTLKLNNLDRNITRLMKRAAKKCRKQRAKGHMYSEELQMAASRCSYWNHLLKSMQPHRNIKKATLHRKGRFARIPYHMPLTKQEVRNEHKAALKTLKDVINNIKEYRRLHLERFAAAIDTAAAKEPGTKMNTLIQLMRFEEDRLIHLKCQNDMGKRRGPGISELMVQSDSNKYPSNNTTKWTIEGYKANVANAIMKQNKKSFSKAFNTPFAYGDLKEALGVDGTTQAGDDMM